ncbi:N-acyl-D-amino-acid deacylase family protein [Sphingomonas colocasiae]|uniref:Amidohydrolase family protein n=1 Tax=Sphingomonas colocasiae TaxID=1848973 RepID=A0ABS7PUK0_9SPHN|nr:amidohydrolase family protein [Sphingomonas colocasiae]MBY8825024.1 amidohydrolase family protein [Sphingomonas colocasiae]
MPGKPVADGWSRRAAIGAVLGAIPVMGGALRAASGGHDLLVRGGQVIDGTGAARIRADVAIRAGRIAAIAPDLAADARDVIDASGLIVAPGFIEPHAHITDIATFPRPENLLRQGITTIANSLHSLDQPYPLAPFLSALRVAPNTLWTAGHSWARKHVMGLANRAPTSGELARMRHLVREAMDDGAFGLGTGLEYIPAAYARTDELVALARAAARPGALYVTHLRDEGARLREAIDEALEIGRAAKLPVHISHLKITGMRHWGLAPAMLARIDDARAAGQRVSFDVYPYTAYSTYSTVLLPPWSLAGGDREFAARAADGATRARIVAEARTLYPIQTGGQLDSLRFRDGVSGFAGRTLGDYLAANGRPPTLDAGIDAIVDLQARGGFTGIFEAMSERDMLDFLAHPAASLSSDGDLFAFGAGFPHPRSYGAFPRFLGHYVRDRALMPLEAAIAKTTSVPARALGLKGRGVLAIGHHADITIFDEAAIADRSTFADPHRHSEGVIHLLVNGVPVIRDSRLREALPGQVIRRGCARTACRNRDPSG